MRDWLIVTTLETSVLIGLVLLARPLIRRAFGASVAYRLWLIPLLGQTRLPGAPFVTGLFRASVFLPEDFLERFSVHEQRWIMAHELTHVRRRDLWFRWVADAFRALFWFNP